MNLERASLGGIKLSIKCRECGGYYRLNVALKRGCPHCGSKEWKESFLVGEESLVAIARLQGLGASKEELIKAIDRAWAIDRELVRVLHTTLNPHADMQGWQTPRDRLIIEQVLINYPRADPVILEVGVYRGGCTNAMLMARRDARLIGIDNWEISPDLKEGFLENTKQFKDRIELITGDSRIVGKMWNRIIDVLLIDAGHEYESVRADIDNFVPWVEEDGIVMVDDYIWGSAVGCAVDETLLAKYELLRDPNPCEGAASEKLIVFRKRLVS